MNNAGFSVLVLDAGFRVQGSGFRVQGSGIGLWLLGFRAPDSVKALCVVPEQPASVASEWYQDNRPEEHLLQGGPCCKGDVSRSRCRRAGTSMERVRRRSSCRTGHAA